MAKRTIPWLVAKENPRLGYRGIERNEAWARRRTAALNLRKAVVVKLRTHDANLVLTTP